MSIDTAADKFLKVAQNAGWQVGSGGVADASTTTIPLVNTTNIPSGTAVIATIDRVDANGTQTPSKMERVVGRVSGNNLVDCIRGVAGTAQAHSAGAVVEVVIDAALWNKLIDGILTEHNSDGTHKLGTMGVMQFVKDYYTNSATLVTGDTSEHDLTDMTTTVSVNAGDKLIVQARLDAQVTSNIGYAFDAYVYLYIDGVSVDWARTDSDRQWTASSAVLLGSADFTTSKTVTVKVTAKNSNASGAMNYKNCKIRIFKQ